jgi:hypothetical protein
MIGAIKKIGLQFKSIIRENMLMKKFINTITNIKKVALQIIQALLG